MKARLNRRDNDYWLHNESGETIASSWGVYGKKLSIKNCNEIFLSSVVDVEKLAEEEYKNHASNEDLYGDSEELQLAYKAGVVDGFNKAMELNKDKQFTEQNLREAYSRGILGGDSVVDRYIKALQPTEIEVEIEMVKTPVKMPGIMVFTKAPKLDSEGCLILKELTFKSE